MSDKKNTTVRVQSETTTSTKQSVNGGKRKVRGVYKSTDHVSDVDTGETVKTKTVQKTKDGKIKKDKTVTTIRQGDGKLLSKNVQNKGRSRVRVTKRGRQAGY